MEEKMKAEIGSDELQKKISNASTSSNDSGVFSQSTNTDESESKMVATQTEADDTDDTGVSLSSLSANRKRAQSLDYLSDRFATSLRFGHEKKGLLSPTKSLKYRQTRFVEESLNEEEFYSSKLGNFRGLSSPALSAPPHYDDATKIPRHSFSGPFMQRSRSIPVHLTVSKMDISELPRGLRPVEYYRRELEGHDTDCALNDHKIQRSPTKKKKVSSPVKTKDSPGRSENPTTPNSRRVMSASPISRGNATTTGQRNHSAKILRPRNQDPNSNRSKSPKTKTEPKSQFLKLREENGGGKSDRSKNDFVAKQTSASTSSICSSSSSASERSNQSGYMRSTKSSALKSSQNEKNERNSLMNNKKGRKILPRAMNASFQIWEIQKELRRGEMVQGLLRFGPGGINIEKGRNQTQFQPQKIPPRSMKSAKSNKRNSDLTAKQDEMCICAPVILGQTDGHIDWRCM